MQKLRRQFETECFSTMLYIVFHFFRAGSEESPLLNAKNEAKVRGFDTSPEISCKCRGHKMKMKVAFEHSYIMFYTWSLSLRYPLRDARQPEVLRHKPKLTIQIRAVASKPLLNPLDASR